MKIVTSAHLGEARRRLNAQQDTATDRRRRVDAAIDRFHAVIIEVQGLRKPTPADSRRVGQARAELLALLDESPEPGVQAA